MADDREVDILGKEQAIRVEIMSISASFRFDQRSEQVSGHDQDRE
jgi:hypothetical protein